MQLGHVLEEVLRLGVVEEIEQSGLGARCHGEQPAYELVGHAVGDDPGAHQAGDPGLGREAVLPHVQAVAGTQVPDDQPLARVGLEDLVDAALDEEPCGGEERFVVGQQGPPFGNEAFEPTPLVQGCVGHQGVGQRLGERCRVTGVHRSGPGQLEDVVAGLPAAALDVGDGLAVQPPHPVRQCCRRPSAEVTLLELAPGAAPAGVVAAQPGPRGFGEGQYLGQVPVVLDADPEPPPQPRCLHGVASVRRVPGQPVHSRAPRGVALDGEV